MFAHLEFVRREDDLLNQRVDDLVAALVLLQLDPGLGRFRKLHRAGNTDGRGTLATLIGRRVDRLHPAREVAAAGRAVMRLDLQRAQRRQLAAQRAGAVFRREALVVVAQDEAKLRVIAHIHIRLLETARPLGGQDASRLVRVVVVPIPVDADGPSCCHFPSPFVVLLTIPQISILPYLALSTVVSNNTKRSLWSELNVMAVMHSPSFK